MSRLTDEKIHRLAKLKKIQDKGVNPYPSRVSRTHTIEETIQNFLRLSALRKPLILVGRLRTIRTHGGMTFAHLEDGTGKMQIVLRRDIIGRPAYEMFRDTIDIGDFIEARGALFLTKKREKSLEVKNFKLLSKSLLPLPEKWHGLSDIEERFRKRYLDLISNSHIKYIFKKRNFIIKTLQEFLDSKDFIEVETPILQPVPGGAVARPFLTHHNALNLDLYLRVAPELYLKRLIVGGYERVYELGRCFRNEGIDHSHNPEFTLLEFYWAYADYGDLMKFTERMFTYLLKKIEKKLETTYEKEKIYWGIPYSRLTFRNALIKYAKIDTEKLIARSLLAKEAKKLGIKVSSADSRARIIDEIFKKYVRPQIIQPTFIIDYPTELSPLAKKRTDDPRYVERFQLVVGGLELVNAYSELNDPIEQEKRFREQEEARGRGEEAEQMDKDFIEALCHGMPPTAGFGMGIDRLTMLLTDTHNIKEVMLFPTLKPEK